jgi:hypothetical protein
MFLIFVSANALHPFMNLAPPLLNKSTVRALSQFLYALGIFVVPSISLFDLHAQTLPPSINPAVASSGRGDINYFRYYTFGGGVHNLGWFVNGRFGRSANSREDRAWEVELWRLKHPKEVRITNEQFINPRPFVFGKLNELILLRGGYSRERLLFEKGPKNGVEWRWRYGGGLSMAFLKPVYLDVLYPIDPADPQYVTVRSERYDPKRHGQSNIYGRSRFQEGLDEMSLQAGVYGRVGLLFEWGATAEELRVLEAGISVDLLPFRPSVMAENIPGIPGSLKNPLVYPSLYFAVHLGNKW